MVSPEERDQIIRERRAAYVQRPLVKAPFRAYRLTSTLPSLVLSALFCRNSSSPNQASVSNSAREKLTSNKMLRQDQNGADRSELENMGKRDE
jgi:hypothetical protein